jgi:hypothetical protein
MMKFDSNSDCCTEDEAHDWGKEELMQPSSLWGPAQQLARKGAVQLDNGQSL